MRAYLRTTLYGPVIWAAQFLLVYASESVFCLHGPGPSAHRLFVAAVSLLAAGVVGLGLVRQRRRGGGDADQIGRWLALLSLVAIAWTALPSLLIASCAAPV